MQTHNTKIIATIGPSCNNSDQLKQMYEAGMNIIRVNASHTTSTDLEQILKKINELRKECPHIGLALDTKGPELRIGVLKEDLEIKIGDKLKFTNSNELVDQNSDYIFWDYSGFSSFTKETEILVDDGFLKLKVEKIEGNVIETIAQNKHVLKSKKSINIPGHELQLPFLSTKDKEDIQIGLSNDIDFIFLSFVSSEEDIKTIRELLKDIKNPPLLISKIESLNGIRNIKKIVNASDGIMVARGDLGAEMGYEKIFSLQKYITEECVRVGKPCICATQMLESVCHSIIPTRAEVTDVGSAILDGCDAVMLSAETASGEYPIIAVEILSELCHGAEKVQREYPSFSDFRIGSALKILASDCEVKKIVILSNSFNEVISVSSVRQPVPLFIVSNFDYLLRKISLLRDCVPIRFENLEMTDELLKSVRGNLKKGDAIIVYTPSMMCIKKYYYND